MHLQTYFKSLLFVFSLTTLATQSVPPQVQAPRLSQFQFGAACVLPTYKNAKGQTMVVLGREAGGKDKGTYDDFGGKRDAGETHPEVTAAREGWEELILGKTGPISVKTFRKYINVDSCHTKYIIARHSKRCVLYITDISKYWNNIRKKFYSARQTTKQWHHREKDHLVVLSWYDLQKAIAQSKPGQIVAVRARGINKNGCYDTKMVTITLRPFLVAKLRPFVQNQPFQQGRHQKIRFYQ